MPGNHPGVGGKGGQKTGISPLPKRSLGIVKQRPATRSPKSPVWGKASALVLGPARLAAAERTRAMRVVDEAMRLNARGLLSKPVEAWPVTTGGPKNAEGSPTRLEVPKPPGMPRAAKRAEDESWVTA